MVKAATADVVVRSRKKGTKVYADVQAQLDRLNSRVKVFGAAAAAAAVGGIALLTAKSFASVDVLAKQADRLGTTTEKLATLQQLAELTGGSSENMSKSLLKASKALGEFNLTGAGTAAPILKQLNLDTQALAALRPDELFQVYAEEIRKLGTRSEQAAASALLFGDRTGEMLNIIDLGSEAFAATEDEVTRYGIALDRVDSAKVEAANDAMLRIRKRAEGVGNVIATKVSPFITDLANRFLDAGTSADVMGDAIDSTLDRIAVGAGIVADAFFGWNIAFSFIEVSLLALSRDIVQMFAAVERGVIDINNRIVESFGGDKIERRSGALTKIEDSLRASSIHANQMRQELIASQKPSVTLGRAITQIRVDADEAAQSIARVRAKLQESGPVVGISDAAGDKQREREAAANEKLKDRGAAANEKLKEREAAAAEKLKERLAGKLATIEAALRTETEREIFAFEQRQEIVDNALEQQLISKDRALEIEEQLQEKHEDAMNKITKKGLTDREKFELLSVKEKTRTVSGFLIEQTAGVARHNKAMFRINQAAAIANAIVNISEGITKAWSFGPILGPPAAAIVAAAGAIQIAAIASASFGGGTTPSAAGSTPTFNDRPLSPFAGATDPDPAASNGQGAVVQIIINGDTYGDDGIRQLLIDTMQELTDADVILIPPSSRNAAEIRGGSGSGG